MRKQDFKAAYQFLAFACAHAFNLVNKILNIDFREIARPQQSQLLLRPSVEVSFVQIGAHVLESAFGFNRALLLIRKPVGENLIDRPNTSFWEVFFENGGFGTGFRHRVIPCVNLPFGIVELVFNAGHIPDKTFYFQALLENSRAPTGAAIIRLVLPFYTC